MPNRIIKESIWSSPNFNTLSAGAERHFFRVLMTSDDFGCFEATPAIIKGRCYPLKPDVSEEDIEAWHTELEDAGLTKFWQHEGRRFGIFVTFQRHQRVRATHQRKTPPPPEPLLVEKRAYDDACRHMSSDDRLNQNHNHNLKEEIVGQPDGAPPFKDIIEYLNRKTGKHFRFDTKDSQKNIRARWTENYTLQDFRIVIDNQVAAWGNDHKMQQYLRPATLFGPKFQSYLNNNHKPDISHECDPVDRLAKKLGVAT